MLSTPAPSRYIEFMYVSTLLEILHAPGAVGGGARGVGVSTLLEILL